MSAQLREAPRPRYLREPHLVPPFGSDDEQLPGSARYAALWITLACITAVIVLVPALPVAVYEPRLSVGVSAVSGIIGLALLQLGLLRFRLLRRSIDLHAGLAFGVLAITNLFTAWAAIPVRNGTLTLENATYFILLARAAAMALFVSGLANAQRQSRYSKWTWSGWLGLACAAILLVLATSVLLSPSHGLPVLVDPSVRQLLATGNPIDDMLAGQHPSLILANVALAVALLVAALGYTSEAHRLHDPHIAALAAALILIFYGQVNTVWFPSLPTDYIAAGDVFRLIAYGLLLSNVMWRTAQDFAATATQDERLRLSRELHDGLAQQLAMLGLRLGRVAEVTTMSDERSHDLEVAQRVLDSACMEARRAIAALRMESVRWEHFEQALAAFAAEFSLTHDVDGRVWLESYDVRLDSQLQADVLRILQESFSNAVRHGQATRIDAEISVQDNALQLTIRDNGSGFDLARARRGIGLRSMSERVERRRGWLSVDSVPGNGTRVQSRLPLAAPKQGQL